MRVFVALELPDKTKDNLLRSAEQLKNFAERGNFTKRENLHVTLHFLGEVAERDLIYVQSAMDGVRDLPAPQIALQQFVVLWGSDVVCAKIRQQNNELTQLHDKLGELLEANRFDVEHRSYRPHVTIVRKPIFSLPFSEVTKSIDVHNKPFVATEVVLYQSILKSDAPVYKELYRVSLQEEPA